MKTRLSKIILIFIVLCAAFVANSTEYKPTLTKDTLRPCVDGLMGFTFLDEYNQLLRKHLFVEKDADVSDYTNLIRMLVIPSFENEKYISISQTESGVYQLVFVEPKTSIWTSIKNAEAPERYREKDIPPPGKIQTKKVYKKISNNLASSVSDVWWGMVKKLEYPPGNKSTTLDGTIYMYSTGLGVCAMSFGYEGENVKMLAEIGNELIEYAKSKDSDKKAENKIIKLANELCIKLNPTNCSTGPANSAGQ